jgi:uncharacterized iron-regulated membrane protein
MQEAECKVRGKPNGRTRPGRLLRKVHLWVAVLFTTHFLLLAVTGVLVQHRELFGLERTTIPRSWLPAGYRPLDPDTGIRADIVITDLHSGKLFGAKGPLVVDLAVLAWIVIMASGFGMILAARRRNNGRRRSPPGE